jgi:SAM-dependent methyltransferase
MLTREFNVIDAPGKVTRGSGLLELWLAKQRAKQANLLIPHHLRDGRILDIGCGSIPYFLSNTKFREKFSLDQLSMPSEVQEKHRVRHFAYDMKTGPGLPFDDGEFNVITLLAVVEHVEPEIAAKILQESYRALASGGVLIVTTPAAWSDGLLRAMAKLGLVSPEEIHEHAFAYSLPSLSVALGQAGFSIRKFKAGYFELWMNLWALGEK